MITFKELKRNLKSEGSTLATRKVALLGDIATQFLAVSIKGMGYEEIITLTYLKQNSIRLSAR